MAVAPGKGIWNLESNIFLPLESGIQSLESEIQPVGSGIQRVESGIQPHP